MCQNVLMNTPQNPTEFSTDILRESPDNPRLIKDTNFKNLGDSMKQFGDLSSFVRNVRTGNLVGGSQRSKVAKAFGEGWVIIERRWETPTAVGTVAVGKVIIFGEPFGYREVDWDEEREAAANVAANNDGAQGQFDQDKLSAVILKMTASSRKLTTLTQDKTADLLRRAGGAGKTPAPKIRKFSADEMRPYVRDFYVDDEDAQAVCFKLLDFIAESNPLS